MRQKCKVKEADKKIINEKTKAANEIIAATNPFNYNAMTKVLKEQKLDGFLARDQKKKEEKRQRLLSGNDGTTRQTMDSNNR